jgi:hypothetical protein
MVKNVIFILLEQVLVRQVLQPDWSGGEGVQRDRALAGHGGTGRDGGLRGGALSHANTAQQHRRFHLEYGAPARHQRHQVINTLS